jgi:hypothetical protein
MSSHPWCSDLARDTAVRAAEDAAASKRPALPEWRDLPKRVAALEREVTRLRGTESHPSAARTEETSQSGLRTDRVTLEVTHDGKPLRADGSPCRAADWRWDEILRGWGLGRGESVRVVPSAEAAAEVERLRAERDELLARWESLRESYHKRADERDAALARVAELEAQAERVDAAVGATAEKFVNGHNALKARVAELEKQWADAEPVAWGFTYANGSIDGRFYNSRSAAEEAVPDSGTVVPLYRAPPPPRGWLTEEEREALAWFANANPLIHGEFTLKAISAIRSLLSRNAPPRVRLPEPPFARSNVAYGDWMMCIEAVRKSLAAAGVEVGDV